MMQIRLYLSILILISSLIISTTAKENDAGQFLVSEKKVKLGKEIFLSNISDWCWNL
jgi:hypothetical protein